MLIIIQDLMLNNMEKHEILLLAHKQYTVQQQARVAAHPEKIWEPSDMSSLHYFLH